MPDKAMYGHDKQQADLRDQGRDSPEGLKRTRKGPLDKNLGRTDPPRQENNDGRDSAGKPTGKTA